MKYGAKPKHCDSGHRHASIAEAERCDMLSDLEAKGDILLLEQQPKYKIQYEGTPICTYIADFRYCMADSGLVIVEDVKGCLTPVFNLKRKLVEAAYPGVVISLYPPRPRKKRKARKAKAKPA